MNTENTESTATRKRGLGTTLLFWFLILSLFPTTVVSVISYRNAKENILENARHVLKSVTRLKADYINFYFEGMERNLTMQSQLESNVAFLEALSDAFQQSGRSIEDFAKSFKARMIHHERGGGLKDYQRTYGYDDILLADVEGNILFSVREADDLGTNMLTGKYSQGHFSAAMKRALETGRAAFSDYGRYAPADNDVAGFILAVVVDDSGNRIGFIVFRLSVGIIDKIMQQDAGMGNTEDIYLIGRDLRKRSNSARDGYETILAEPVKTEITRRWHEEHADSDPEHHNMKEDTRIYDGPRGLEVLGIHKDVFLADVPMGIVAEIDTAEAFAPAYRLRRTVIIVQFAVSLIVILIASIITRRIVTPIRTLSEGVERVAEGDLTREVTIQTHNEIGELAEGFNTMLAHLRQSSETIAERDWLVSGQNGLDGAMRGDAKTAGLADTIVSFVAGYLKIPVGALFVKAGEDRYELAAGYGCNIADGVQPAFKSGEGVAGQAVLDGEILSISDAPEHYLDVRSGLVDGAPTHIHAVPCRYHDDSIALLELGTFSGLTDLQLEFLKQAAEPIAVAVSMARSREAL
ncbi:MAG: HAMP domain-containing protein [Desulfobacterales bacterium]